MVRADGGGSGCRIVNIASDERTTRPSVNPRGILRVKAGVSMANEVVRRTARGRRHQRVRDSPGIIATDMTAAVKEKSTG